MNTREALIEFTLIQVYNKGASNSESGNQVKKGQWGVIIQATGL